MKLKSLFSLLAIAAAITLTPAVKAASTASASITTTNASGGTTTISNPLQTVETQIVPPGVSLPAFDTNGLDFTNVNYKAATGFEYESSGGVLAYLQFDADLYHTSVVDLGAGGEFTLGTGDAGLHSAAVDFELLKDFSNFQLVGKAGVGGYLDTGKSVFGELVAEVNYNLTSGTGIGFLGGKNGFTYVGANVSLEANGVDSGSLKLQKVFRVYMGFAF